MYKYFRFIALLLTSTIFGVELNLSGLSSQFNRQHLFVISEYLKACQNGDTKKATGLLRSIRASCLGMADKKNEIEALLQNRIPLAEITDNDGRTGLMLAAAHGHAKTIAAILPFHNAHQIRMRDIKDGYNAETWAQGDTESDECLILIQNRLTELT